MKEENQTIGWKQMNADNRKTTKRGFMLKGSENGTYTHNAVQIGNNK